MSQSGHSIVIFSNCQGEAIQAALRSLLVGTDIPVHLVASYHEFTETQAQQLTECTVLLEQVQRTERCPIDTYVKPGTPRFRFPVMYTMAMWPFSQAGRGGEPDDRPKLFDVPINDDQIKALMEKGGDMDAVIDEYEALDYTKLTDLHGTMERNRAMIRDLETRADIALWEGVEKRLSSAPTFHCFYHPYAPVMYPAAKAACEFAIAAVGGATGAVEGMLSRWLFGDAFDLHQVPIHPSVARAFGLNWVKPDTRYRLRYQGALTFREFWRAYLTNDVDDTIERAALLAEDRNAPCLAMLDATPGNSPDRDVIRARALLYCDRTQEAKALAADVLDRNDPRVYRRMALDTWLRAAADRRDPGDCARAAQVLAEHPDDSAVQYFGGFLLRHAGQPERGGEALLRAAKLCPGDVIYAHNAGLVQDGLGLKAEAILSFNRAVQYAPPETRASLAEFARTFAANNSPSPATA
ncbi:MAG TPA: WcbI family polysaccharide biosynthesis putative acetyltransferase [Asticcacaulis sp.]|nr:WcbI family polysaccharide biosynthesis putative acetyltransferase [Asticcacaulis sp.]